MKRVLIIGVGGVGSVVANKCAQNLDVFSHIGIASRTFDKCRCLLQDMVQRYQLEEKASYLFSTYEVNADEVLEIEKIILEDKPDIIINCALPAQNCNIMQACADTGVHYLDTAVAQMEDEINLPPDDWYKRQYAYADLFKNAGVLGVLSIGFDPGVVNVYCTYAQKHLFDEIDTIKIMDVNAGDNGHKFATNFNPEVNLIEISENPHYWSDGTWHKIEPHSRSVEFDFPVVGKHRIYTMGHDEVHSLYRTMKARHIEFLMGFSENYLKYFHALRDVGLLSIDPVVLDDGRSVIPVKVVKAVLPEPASLAAKYTGKTCIGCLIEGIKDRQPKKVFIYNICDHEASFKEVGSQAISYTAGVPAVTAAILIAQGIWNEKGLFHVEELDPDPFMNIISEQGLPWEIIDYA
jgi:carboxynorspermidine synthase